MNNIKITNYNNGSLMFPRYSGVKLTHIPTGITASCGTSRSEHANKYEALLELKRKLNIDYGNQLDLFI